MSINHPAEKQVIELGNYERCLLLILINGGKRFLSMDVIEGQLKEMGWAGVNLAHESIDMAHIELLDLMLDDTRRRDEFSGSNA